MKIIILAFGSRGDVQPLVALGMGLQADGHEICLATHATFERVVRDAGLGFFLIQNDPREWGEGEAEEAAAEAVSNPLRSLRLLARAMNQTILQTGADFWAACQEMDMILYSPLGSCVAMPIAEKLNVPAVGCYLQPVHRTRAFPSMALPDPRNLGPILNRLTYLLTDFLWWAPYRPAVNQFRQEQLNLPPISRWVNSVRQWQQHSPVILGFSSHAVPKPPDWGDHVKIAGYWFLDTPADWQPPADLVEFLAAGPSPVYIGFGSMSIRKPEETTDIAVKALAHTQQRGLLATGWGGLSQTDLPHNVFAIEAVPHDWLFPQMAAVVHHGGAGTTAAGLRAGVPTIVVPHFVDQPFWGRRVADLGVGPQPIPRKKLSVERLAAAIEAAVSDKEMQQRVTTLGERIRAEDGVTRAVEMIENWSRQV